MSDTTLHIVTWGALAVGIVVLLVFLFSRHD
jgi:hypothetical protein